MHEPLILPTLHLPVGSHPAVKALEHIASAVYEISTAALSALILQTSSTVTWRCKSDRMQTMRENHTAMHDM